MKIQKIAIMGAGALGSYYGAILAKAGYDVTFIAREATLNAFKNHGIEIKSHFGDFSLPSVKVADNPQTIELMDLILFTVKTFDAEHAATLIKEKVGINTIVLPLQTANVTDVISRIVGQKHLMGAVTYISCEVESPGVIRQSSSFRRIVIGEFNKEKTDRLQEVYNLFTSAGVETIVADDIQKEIWSKFIYIAPQCGVGSVIKLPLGKYRNLPESRNLLIQAMKEIESVAREEGVDLDADIVEQKMQAIDNMSPDAINSMQRDVMSGKRSELEEFIGRIVRLGKKYKISTPVHDFMYAVLKPRELLLGVSNSRELALEGDR